MGLDTISAIFTILANSGKALNSLREQAKSRKDENLKETISTLYDDFLSLKELISRLTDENAQLRRTVQEHNHPAQKPIARQVGKVVYVFDGEQGPYCHPCYMKGKGLVLLAAKGPNEKQCSVCGLYFQEQESRRQTKIASDFPF